MYVIKRDGSQEPLNIEQIRKQTIPATEGLSNVSYEELELDSQLNFQDGILTSDIQSTLIKTAINKVNVDTPDWTYVAQRLTLYDLYHRVKKFFNKKVRGDVYQLITLKDYIEKNKNIFSEWTYKYTDKEIEELNKEIDGNRDLLYDYPGFCLMEDMYLAKNEGLSSELPQHFHMGVSMFVMQNEPAEKRLQLVKDMYHMVSKLEYVNATPINANGRKKSGGLISCLLTTIEDDSISIMDGVKEVALSSRQGSGLGIDVSRIRSIGSDIGINKNAAGGKIPFLKILNEVASAFDQGKCRKGAFACYLEAWDLEVFDFMDLRKTSGEERRRARDLFLAISYPDIFFEREEENGDWILFDPKDVPMLTETFGDGFRMHYLQYEREYLNQTRKFNPNTRVVKARDVLREHIKSWSDVGMPFMMFKDNVNKVHKYAHLGPIRSSNLCTEVTVFTNENYTGVCNLGSINLARTNKEEDLKRVAKLALRIMDNCIDLTMYPSDKSRNFQRDFRACGCGSMGEAEYIANKQIMFGSEEHKQEIDRIWSTIKNTLLETSKELAEEKGECKHNPGYRNAYFSAIAPNSSSAIMAGTTNGLEPVYNKIWVEENKRGSYIMTAPHININNFEYYKNPYEIDMFKQLDVAAVRQKHIDMAMSINLFLDPEGLGVKKVRDLIVHAWKNGLKTLYYLRSKPPKTTGASNDNGISCVGCAN